ncbi:MAG TPA: type III-B CRISPR module RAMP protein Cmr4 [Pyrinomonadaceae bacterium]|nr:type III-B CRISPR module RAMP protein Cmr4 [Pyrinomonadaceae bacterium]
MSARLLFTHAISPLHAGTGQGVGAIDLPIAREKATGIPYLPGSSVKGTLRDLCKESKDKKEAVYGPETTNADEFAGAAQFADQRLLMLPIRSLSGTFAWVTSPYLLKRFLRDAKDSNAGVATAKIAQLSVSSVDDKKAVVVKASSGSPECALKLKVENVNKVVLEDLDLETTEEDWATNWAQFIGPAVFDESEWQTMFSQRFCVVSDNVLSFLLDTATEITARIKLRDDGLKTVQKGGLWYEEALPTETILYGFVLATPTAHHKKQNVDESEIFRVIEDSIQPMVQLGGKATVGRGLCRLQLEGAA